MLNVRTLISSRERGPPALWLLALMMAVGPFGDTEYTPAMPDISHSLHAGYGAVQFTMASYLFGSAVARLLYGPASDRFGRRPVMIVGTAILLAGAILCTLSFNIWPLVFGRLVQGLGACAGGVIAEAVVRDTYPADQRQSTYAKLNATFALAPALGPVVGTYAAKGLGWHGNFALLVLLSMTLLVLIWWLQGETVPERKPHAMEPARLWRNYVDILTTRGFAFYSVLGGFCIGVVYTALIGAPDLVINILGRGSVAIMIVAVSILGAFVAGATSCMWLSSRISALAIIALGLLVLVLGSTALLVVGLVAGTHGDLAAYLTPIATCFVGVGLVEPVATSRAMGPFRYTTGAASSMLGFVQMTVAGLGTLAMSALHAGSVLDTPGVFLALTGLGVLLFVTYIARQGGPARVERRTAEAAHTAGT